MAPGLGLVVVWRASCGSCDAGCLVCLRVWVACGMQKGAGGAREQTGEGSKDEVAESVRPTNHASPAVGPSVSHARAAASVCQGAWCAAAVCAACLRRHCIRLRMLAPNLSSLTLARTVESERSVVTEQTRLSLAAARLKSIDIDLSSRNQCRALRRRPTNRSAISFACVLSRRRKQRQVPLFFLAR